MEGQQTNHEIKKDFTCSKRGCKKICEEVFYYSSYHRLAVKEGLDKKSFCKECFEKKDEEYSSL